MTIKLKFLLKALAYLAFFVTNAVADDDIQIAGFEAETYGDRTGHRHSVWPWAGFASSRSPCVLRCDSHTLRLTRLNGPVCNSELPR